MQKVIVFLGANLSGTSIQTSDGVAFCDPNPTRAEALTRWLKRNGYKNLAVVEHGDLAHPSESGLSLAIASSVREVSALRRVENGGDATDPSQPPCWFGASQIDGQAQRAHFKHDAEFMRACNDLCIIAMARWHVAVQITHRGDT
jgi:hypothetical protein